MNEKKTAEEAAYKFAEVILGQPAFDKDDTIVVGFLGGVEYAAQETAALHEENERLKEAILKEIEVIYWEVAHDTSITLSQSDAARKWIRLVKERIEKLKS